MNDLLDISILKEIYNPQSKPQSAGVPIDQGDHESNHPLSRQKINNNDNLILSKNIRSSAIKQKLNNNNINRVSTIKSPNKKKRCEQN